MTDRITTLETRITYLEKHIAEQDSEMFQLSKRIDTLVKVAKEQKAQLAAMAELNAQNTSSMPADEKPPHY